MHNFRSLPLHMKLVLVSASVLMMGVGLLVLAN